MHPACVCELTVGMMDGIEDAEEDASRACVRVDGTRSRRPSSRCGWMHPARVCELTVDDLNHGGASFGDASRACVRVDGS